MADKYIYLDSGKLKEREVTVTSTGASEAGDAVGLDGTGKLDTSVMPTGIGPDTKTLVTSEDFGAGDWVNVYDSSGTPTARKADATTAGKEAHGFVLASSTAGGNATVYTAGINDQLSGLTGGTEYFLDTTAGGETATAPSGSGNVVQSLGVALSATEIAFNRAVSVQVA